jgi:pimeloyl-ACP methyl ester carboxylesterase
MAFLKTTDGVNLFYNDWGAGRPVVLIHGWPLDADMWSEQAVFLAERGVRVVAYDRRGFGRSDQTSARSSTGFSLKMPFSWDFRWAVARLPVSSVEVRRTGLRARHSWLR